MSFPLWGSRVSGLEARILARAFSPKRKTRYTARTPPLAASHPGGEMSETETTYDPRYLAGVLLFNRQDYFEAHEAWEDLWSESHGPARKFYQGLIQAAVGVLISRLGVG